MTASKPHKDKSSAMSEPPPTYNAGENVLCYHGPLIYVAKILKTQAADESEKNTITGKEGEHYFVHYKGWKTTCARLYFWVQARTNENHCC